MYKIYKYNLSYVEVMDIYREMFPREYAASQSAPYSTAREQEFYRLVAQKLFPLDLEEMEGEPEYFLPGIQIKNLQLHDWMNGCCPFERIEVVFKLAIIL